MPLFLHKKDLLNQGYILLRCHFLSSHEENNLHNNGLFYLSGPTCDDSLFSAENRD